MRLKTIAICLFATATIASGCTTAGSDVSEADTSAPSVVSTASNDAGTTTVPASPSSTPLRAETTSPLLEPASLDEVLPVVCDFERYNGLRILSDATVENPAGYEQSLEVFVRLILDDRSLPTDESSATQIDAERARCDALSDLTFANGTHPVGKQIETTTFRTLVPVQQSCSWVRKDAEGNVAEEGTVEPGSTIEIVVEPTDRSVRIDGCGIFVAGNPPTER